MNQNISVAGMRGTWNNCTLDGLADTDPDFNVYIRIPSIEALQEFKVVSGIYSAEFGREVAQINGSAKSGTNDFRVHRNSDLGAKPFDFLAASPAKAPL